MDKISITVQLSTPDHAMVGSSFVAPADAFDVTHVF
jgi:hypothetical protein